MTDQLPNRQPPSKNVALHEAVRVLNLCWEAAIGASSQPEFTADDALRLKEAHAAVLQAMQPSETSPPQSSEQQRKAACDDYIREFDRIELPSPREAFQAGWDACMRRPRATSETSAELEQLRRIDKTARELIEHLPDSDYYQDEKAALVEALGDESPPQKATEIPYVHAGPDGHSIHEGPRGSCSVCPTVCADPGGCAYGDACAQGCRYRELGIGGAKADERRPWECPHCGTLDPYEHAETCGIVNR